MGWSKLALSFVVLAFSTFAWAQEAPVAPEAMDLGESERPRSQLRTDLFVGSNEYSEFNLSGWHTVNPDLDLGVNLRSTKFGAIDWVRGVGLSAAFRQNQDNSTSVNGDFSSYSTSLRSRAFRAFHRYNVASLWEADRRTEIGLGLETAVYEEDRQNTVRQNGLNVGLDQELGEIFTVGGAATFFWVPNRDRAQVSSLLQSFESTPLVRAAAGLLRQSMTFYVSAMPFEKHIFEFSVNKADPMDDQVAAFLTASLRWDFVISDTWGVGASIATTGQHGGQNSRTSTLGAGLSYAF